MTDNSKKVSELPQATTLAKTDRVVILRDPSGSPSVRTITVDNLSNSLRYANNTVSGVVKVGDNLSINETGFLSSDFPVYANDSIAGIIKVGDYLTVNATGYLNAEAGVSISDFGEGFSLTDSDKIVTNKLYSTNETQSTQHYRLTLDTNGVVHLPDESIINGATLKTVPGDGNWAGITAGPVGKDEDSWVWVDNYGTWIATDYSNNAFTWNFDNSGNLTSPLDGKLGDIFEDGYGFGWKSAPGGYAALSSNNLSNYIAVDDETSYIETNGNRWDFGSTGVLTLPAAGEIHSFTGTGPVTITSHDTTDFSWTFGVDAVMLLPDYGSVPTAAPTGPGFAQYGGTLYWYNGSTWQVVSFNP